MDIVKIEHTAVALDNFYSWTEQDVQTWLKQLDNGSLFANILEDQHVNGQALGNLSYERLVAAPFNMIGGYALQLDAAIKGLKMNYYKSVSMGYYEKMKAFAVQSYTVTSYYTSKITQYLPPMERISTPIKSLLSKKQELPTHASQIPQQ